MCGIFFCVSSHAHVQLNAQDEECLRARGPDALNSYTPVVHTGSRSWYLTFMSSVLALRGDKIVSQPVVDEVTGSVFCWNGEAWLYDLAEMSGNDTENLSRRLFDAVQRNVDAEPAILEILSKITGPYAFVFYNAKTSMVYFGRDSLGRRSLLTQSNVVQGVELTVSSISMTTINNPAREVDTLRIHKLDLKQLNITIQIVPSPSAQPKINKSVPCDTDAVGIAPSLDAMTTLLDQLRASLRPRVKGIPTFVTQGKSRCPSRIAILFSGGLDCTLLARLVHHILPHDQPVDLLNVAFENPRVVDGRNKKDREGSYDYNSCPDRRTGQTSYTELSKRCPERIWRFVAVNVPYEEFLNHRSTVIQLMHPHNTEMDLSIASALYFAARGQGTMKSSANAVHHENLGYDSAARVLLSGLGADELFGGYSRHSAAFDRGGYEALINELELDFNRIGTRNLGRDDRVLSHWGRETRFPYLDEQFVAFALGLPVWEKCGFRPGRVVPSMITSCSKSFEDMLPEKMLLRCAAWHLGMRYAATERKRAIQFGAKSAKMHSGKTKGTDLVMAEEVPEISGKVSVPIVTPLQSLHSYDD